jgi:hypothetical protein
MIRRCHSPSSLSGIAVPAAAAVRRALAASATYRTGPDWSRILPFDQPLGIRSVAWS